RRTATGRAVATLSLLLATSAIAAGCGGGKPASASAGSAKLDAPGKLEPPTLAPEIALRDSTGRLVRLSQFRGKAVLLTFIYDHCPDTCPLIVAKLHRALVELGSRAKQVQVVAVSVDPRGDTPQTVKAFLAEHQMTGRMEYLIGSWSQLASVWRAYDIAAQGTPDSREVSHTALVYGITGKGVRLALYDQAFEPSEIAHDVPLLAAM
ncbi:MAG TPA: SCO family protein, partial [Solirubrobacteraceae bacterium]|nr:SCO family protein [Solirubrobacteraceae bacterium]